ncbi:MAG: prepilin-type N-terminal cleavage/methylation domain-containing protein [Candidatus Riflebacteria bacterium]|nr:prepilin-type N-terminal cleavage/methylation domain-containing protein [Candidatus Riflebacteria bacterium]
MTNRTARGFSLIEVVLGIAILAAVGGAALRVFSDTALPQQAMIRDYTVAMNICERFLNSLHNDLAEGTVVDNMSEKDVTESILDNPAIQDYLKIFAGGVGKDTTSLTTNFKALLTVKPGPGAQSSVVKNIKLTFIWESGGKHHSFALESYVYTK